MEVTRKLVEDVAAELGINEPSLVEKDFHVVHALSLLADFHSPNFELVFAGGTCLSKTFATLQRMSEDVDLKILLTKQGLKLNNSERRRELSMLKHNVQQLLESGEFTISSKVAHNQNQYIEFEIIYPAMFDVSDALRPNIKIELTVCNYDCGRENKAVTSLIAQVIGDMPEVEAFSCINVKYTAAEKLVSLLRRTAASLRGIDEWSDDALIRHLYDLHVINRETILTAGFIRLVHETVVSDGKQFANKYKEFFDNPEEELKKSLAALNNQSQYRQQYERFLGPLVYAQKKPTYAEVLITLNSLAEGVWGAKILPADISENAPSIGVPGWNFYCQDVAGGKYQGVAKKINKNGTTTRMYGYISTEKQLAIDKTISLIRRINS